MPEVLHRQPYVHGWADDLSGKGFLDNPYPENSNEFRIWIDGKVDCIIARRTALEEARRHFPPIWVVHDHPLDAPDKFLVRVWYGPVAESQSTHHDTLEDARESIVNRGGSLPLMRADTDDPVIVETWV